MNDRWEVHPCRDRLGHVTSYDICLPRSPEDRGVTVIASVYSGEELANQIAELWNTRSSPEVVTVLIEAAKPFANSVRIDPDKKRGDRHWATYGTVTNLDDVLRLQAALSKLSPLVQGGRQSVRS